MNENNARKVLDDTAQMGKNYGTVPNMRSVSAYGDA